MTRALDVEATLPNKASTSRLRTKVGANVGGGACFRSGCWRRDSCMNNIVQTEWPIMIARLGKVSCQRLLQICPRYVFDCAKRQ